MIDTDVRQSFWVYAWAYVLAILCSCTLLLGFNPKLAFADMVPTGDNDTVVLDEPIRGGIAITKRTDADKKAEGDAKVEGTKFAISLKYGLPVEVNNSWFDVGETILTLTCDADGNCSIDSDTLPYGTYLITEVATGDGLMNQNNWTEDDRTFTILEDGKIVKRDYPVKNPIYYGKVGLTKEGSFNGAKITGSSGNSTLAGIEFGVYNRSAQPIRYYKDGYSENGQYVEVAPGAMGSKTEGLIDKIYTDANGNASLKDKSLPYGTYEIIELDAHTEQTGFITVDWSSGAMVCHEENTSWKKYAADNPSDPIVSGDLKVIKYDVILDDNKPQGNASLDAQYTVYNNSDNGIVTDRGVINKGDPFLVLESDPNTGIATSVANALPFGSYIVKETRAPRGYKIDENWSYEFDIISDNQHVDIPKAKANKNPPYLGSMKFMKVDMNTGSNQPQGNGNFNGVELTVYNISDNAIVYKGRIVPASPNKRVPSAESKIDTIVLNKGLGALDDDVLPCGTYLVKETKVPGSTGYHLNPTWMATVTFDDFAEIESVVYEGEGTGDHGVVVDWHRGE